MAKPCKGNDQRGWVQADFDGIQVHFPSIHSMDEMVRKSGLQVANWCAVSCAGSEVSDVRIIMKGTSGLGVMRSVK